MAEGVAGLLAGAILLGAIHGIEPGHGWPVAASYALDRSNRWLYGFAASLILGIGHLVSSIAMVAVFFYAKSYFELTQLNEPIVLGGTVEIGGPVSLVAGVLLIALGVREYRHGHSHGHGDHSHDEHSHGDDAHAHESGTAALDHDHGEPTGDEAFPYAVPADAGGVAIHGDDSPPHGHGGDADSHDGGGDMPAHTDDGDAHSHGHGLAAGQTDRGLFGIAWFAFVLGFAHEEEFEIIALCAGSTYCLELMLAYAATVILGIVGLTLLLIAGYQEFEAEVERYAQYLPLFSAVVLVGMGVGFVTGLF